MSFKRQLMNAAIAGALACAGASVAIAKDDQTKAEKDRIAAEYKSAKAKCDSLKGNAKDICVAEAKGANKVAKAELEARNKDTPKARQNVAVAKAEAEYDVAKEKCDDLSGKDKSACVKDAKAALKSAKANAKADVKVSDARRDANQKVSEARKDAAEDRREANYDAAKARCDKFSGDAKERCINDAKAQSRK